MFSLKELLNSNNIDYSIAHPGVTPTEITRGYPKIIRGIIKYPMKWVFNSPKKSCLSVIYAMFNKTEEAWVGPRIFNVWGKPKVKHLKVDKIESKKIFELAETIVK